MLHELSWMTAIVMIISFNVSAIFLGIESRLVTMGIDMGRTDISLLVGVVALVLSIIIGLFEAVWATRFILWLHKAVDPLTDSASIVLLFANIIALMGLVLLAKTIGWGAIKGWVAWDLLALLLFPAFILVGSVICEILIRFVSLLHIRDK